jgi:hypothetical protein
MPEYRIILTIDLRLTGEMIIEAENMEEAQVAAQEMLENNVLDMDYTIYEGDIQSEDIFWDQEVFDIGIREVREILENNDDEPPEV